MSAKETLKEMLDRYAPVRNDLPLSRLDMLDGVCHNLPMDTNCLHCDAPDAPLTTNPEALFWLGEQAPRFCNQTCEDNYNANQG